MDTHAYLDERHREAYIVHVHGKPLLRLLDFWHDVSARVHSCHAQVPAANACSPARLVVIQVIAIAAKGR